MAPDNQGCQTPVQSGVQTTRVCGSLCVWYAPIPTRKSVQTLKTHFKTGEQTMQPFLCTKYILLRYTGERLPRNPSDFGRVCNKEIETWIAICGLYLLERSSPSSPSYPSVVFLWGCLHFFYLILCSILMGLEYRRRSFS